VDQMTCPRCKGIATRDPANREDRFQCDCGWSSWETRVQQLQKFLARESEQERER